MKAGKQAGSNSTEVKKEILHLINVFKVCRRSHTEICLSFYFHDNEHSLLLLSASELSDDDLKREGSRVHSLHVIVVVIPF
jgi:hypothetical protein